MVKTGIRPYTLGKFSTLIDMIVWDASLGGWEAESYGDSDIGEYAGLVYVPTVADLHMLAKDAGISLNFEEVDYLTHHAAAIVSSDSNGFVYVEYFESFDEAAGKFDSYREAFYLATSADEADY